MLNIPGIIRHLSLMLLLAGFGVQAVAGDATIQWTPKTLKGGFTVNVPSIDNDALISEIAGLKIVLMQDEKQLSREVEQKRFKDKDTVMAALLPGGLLYAVYKKSIHARAVEDYKLTSSLLKEISSDLVALATVDGPLMVAQAPGNIPETR